jgi:hypothetical protein
MFSLDFAKRAPAVWTALSITLVPGLAFAGSVPPEVAAGRLSLALGAAPAPVRTEAQPAPPTGGRPEVGAFRLGATIGLDFASDFTGYAIRPQVAYTVAGLGRGVYFDLAGHFGVTLGGATGYSGQYLEVVPALRLRDELGSRVSLYGDFGLGFFSLHTSIDNNLGSSTITGAVLRLATGLRYAIGSGADLVFEPGGFNFYFNTNANKFHYSLLAGILVRI